MGAAMSVLLRILTAMVVLAVGSTVASPAGAASTGSISGTLTGPGGDPVQGIAQPWLRSEGQWYPAPSTGGLTTWPSGDYTIGDLDPGQYLLLFLPRDSMYPDLAPEFYPNAATPESATLVQVDAGEAVTGVDNQFAVGVTLSGTVTDSAGSPVTAYVTADLEFGGETSRLRFSGATDASPTTGHYEITGLAPGAYVVGFGSSRYVGEYYQNTRNLAAATPVTVPATGIDAQLESFGGISGRVTVPPGADPRDVMVELFWDLTDIGDPGAWGASERAWAAADGRYTITGLEPGRYRVKFIYLGVQTRYYRSTTSFTDAAAVQVGPGLTTTGIDQKFERLTPAMTLRAKGGKRLVKAKVAVAPTAGTAYGHRVKATGTVRVKVGKLAERLTLTNGKARVVLDGVPKGKHTVKVRYSGDVVFATRKMTAVVKVR